MGAREVVRYRGTQQFANVLKRLLLPVQSWAWDRLVLRIDLWRGYDLASRCTIAPGSAERTALHDALGLLGKNRTSERATFNDVAQLGQPNSGEEDAWSLADPYPRAPCMSPLDLFSPESMAVYP